MHSSRNQFTILLLGHRFRSFSERVLIANTKPCRRARIPVPDTGFDRPLERHPSKLTETGKWYRFSANFLPLDGIESEIFLFLSPLLREIKWSKWRAKLGFETGDKIEVGGERSVEWMEICWMFSLGEFARGSRLCNDFSD